jgi:hemolysin-activating ACP:hemolysin acyltransferase
VNDTVTRGAAPTAPEAGSQTRAGTEAAPGAAGPGAGAHGPGNLTAVNSRLATSLGKLVAAMLVSPAHRDLPLSEVADRVLPALSANQFVVAEAVPQGATFTAPVGLILWARVSEAVDRRLLEDLTSPMPLAAGDWSSGDRLWLVEATGGARVIEAMLRQLLEGPFAGKPFRLRRRGADGRYVVETIDPAEASG